MTLPLALRTFQVPWPTQVKLTSGLSAIPVIQYQAKTEKAILPHAQNEDADRAERPEVGEDDVARLPVKREQARAEQREDPEPAPLDRPDDEQQDQRQEPKRVGRHHFVGDERAERKPEGHAVGRVPTAAPGRPGGAGREDQGAEVRKRERDSR